MEQGSSTRTIHVYTNAPFVRLWKNGKLVQVGNVAGHDLIAVPFFGFATFVAVAFDPGNLTAEALDSDGKRRLATHTSFTSGIPTRIRLSLDAPSLDTGTGSTLVADGQDVALVRAELVDHHGRLVSPRDNATNTSVSFSVKSGAGRILGVISGSPWNQPLDEPYLDQTGTRFPAHYGVVAAFVQSTRVCIGSSAERSTLLAIHVDAGRNGTSKIGGASCSEAPADIVISAHALGMPVSTLHIPTTNDPADLPLAIAAKSSARVLPIETSAGAIAA